MRLFFFSKYKNNIAIIDNNNLKLSYKEILIKQIKLKIAKIILSY